ncbi:hypothetical protein [Novosphingobium sp. UBA1939]|uniref:hypothetical protein n=1 Tax=Novosphingobium sp. UBA1939 TaxID=1946982 RepID=UPI0025CDED09|nr:hypothetical protein [Novosphingobium sp. UBA1939]
MTGKRMIVAALVGFEAVGLGVLHGLSAGAASRMALFDPAGLLPLFAGLKAFAVCGELLLATLVSGSLAQAIVAGATPVDHDRQRVDLGSVCP